MNRPHLSGTDLAPPGKLWVCGACGKKSRTRYGFIDNGTPNGGDFLPDGTRVADKGWDESCMMNAMLCFLGVGDTEPRVDMGWYRASLVERIEGHRRTLARDEAQPKSPIRDMLLSAARERITEMERELAELDAGRST